MNAVLKFRKNKQVPKAQNGLKFVRAGTTTWGVPIWADTTTGNLYATGANPNEYLKKYPNSYTPNSDDYLGQEYKFKNFWKALIGEVYDNTIKGSDYIVKKAPDKKLDTYTETMKHINGGVSLVAAKSQINWNDRFALGFTNTLSEDLKSYLQKEGVDISNALSMLTFLNSKGFDVGGVDNKWGKNSQAAWQAFSEKIMNPAIAESKKPVVDDVPVIPEIPMPVMDAVDPFGYESKGNYALDKASSLKDEGIRDYASMVNYVKGNQNSAFAQDMIQRFGDLSTWNKEKIEKDMGVSGNYGRKDRSRIQGFMAGNLAAWNNQRQLAINNYAKKTFLRNQGVETLGQDIPGVNEDLAFIQPTEKEYNWNTWQ